MSGKHEVQDLCLPVPWGHIAAKAWGSPSDKHVLMVHGIMDNAGSFDRLVPQLPSGFHYIAIDLPGHGLSSHFPPGVPLNFFDYVLAIRITLNKLNWKKCIYIGHSLGAQIGLSFSAIYPERVEKVISLDSIGILPIQNNELISRIRLVHDNSIDVEDQRIPLRMYTREEVIHGLMSLRISALTIEAAEALFIRNVTKVGDLYQYNRDPRLKNFLRPLMNLEQTLTFIRKLKVPTLFLLATSSLPGSDDERLGKIVKAIQTQNTHSFVIVQGNHDVHNNHPERVLPHIHKCLSSLRSSL